MAMRYGLIKNGNIRQIVETDTAPAIAGNWQPLPDGREAIGDAWPWNPPAPPAPPAVISAQDFWDRFTKQERVLLDIAEQHNPADPLAKQKTAAERRLRRRDIDRNGTINLSKNWVAQYLLDMETDGILAAGRATVVGAP